MKIGIHAVAAVAFSFIPATAGPAPSQAVLEQVLTKRFMALRPGGMTERNVLFQEVRAGAPAGDSYPFQVTLVIRDYGPGYPANRYYGETCVSRIERTEYTLMRDNYGNWQAEGAMTPPLANKQCKPNPAAGTSSIPLTSLPGSPAPAGEPAAAPPAGGNGETATMARGSYECWANGQARMLMNFSIRSASEYAGSDGRPGSFVLAPGGRVTFRGGALDGVLPAGFYAVYYAPGGRPTVSFRNPGGSEVTFCQKVR